MRKFFQRFDGLLYQELPLLVLLLLLIVLRIPNLFEPYWYGDEAIYLTIGNALRHGELLYAEIVDHKTPLIYYFAMVPNQLWFRILNISWMVVATVSFYHLALRLFEQLRTVVIASTIFMLLTTLPWFEGNIPNGELFVMGFVLLGGVLLLYTKYFQIFVEKHAHIPFAQHNQFRHSIQQAVGKLLTNTHDLVLYLVAGILFGLAILTKVPALFDVAAFFSIAWFSLTNTLNLSAKKRGKWLQLVVLTLYRSGFIFLGILIPLVGSILYYVLRGTGADYLDFGLLYNFRYVKTWELNFVWPILGFFFSMFGKLTLTVAVVLFLTILRDKIKPSAQFALTWFILALFGATLSNRPYPHYYLQVVPALSLLFGFGISFSEHSYQSFKQYLGAKMKAGLLHKPEPVHWIEAFLSGLGIVLFLLVLLLLGVIPYQTSTYYSRMIQYATRQIGRPAFYNSFDAVTSDNYKAAEIIGKSPDESLFIWGTNPMLYALSGKVPVGRFTVSFHIKDLGVYQETMDAVLQEEPEFIVVMYNEQTELPGLQPFLDEAYIPNYDFSHFILWKKAYN